MEITVSADCKEWNIDNEILDEIKNAIETIGKLYNVENSEVSVNLTDDKTIHKLNKDYRGIDRPTDVLSFAFRESEEPQIFYGSEDDGNIIDTLGDIIISVERAKFQAEEYGHSLRREIIFLTVHGMLHLLGYDHMEEEERIEMEQEQKFIMDKLGITR